MIKVRFMGHQHKKVKAKNIN